jgi:hypothetical protein
MIGFMVECVIFVVCVVIIVLVCQWALAKLGVTIDPTLRVVIGLVIFLVCFVAFLNMTGHPHQQRFYLAVIRK